MKQCKSGASTKQYTEHHYLNLPVIMVCPPLGEVNVRGRGYSVTLSTPHDSTDLLVIVVCPPLGEVNVRGRGYSVTLSTPHDSTDLLVKVIITPQDLLCYSGILLALHNLDTPQFHSLLQDFVLYLMEDNYLPNVRIGTFIFMLNFHR